MSWPAADVVLLVYIIRKHRLSVLLVQLIRQLIYETHKLGKICDMNVMVWQITREAIDKLSKSAPDR